MKNKVATSLSPELPTRLLAYRKDQRWTQGELARALATSQPTVSRLERSVVFEVDRRLLAAIAALLACQMSDLVSKDVPKPVNPTFIAFCPNALCYTNTPVRRLDGTAGMKWESARSYPLSGFERVNVCGACGTKLVKQCPGCKRCLAYAGARYCLDCGAEIFPALTAKEQRLLYDKLDAYVEELEWRMQRGWEG